MTDSTQEWSTVSVNGRLQTAATAGVSVYDPGFLLGVGLFETLLVEEGIPIFLEDHLRRLADGMRRLKLPVLNWDPATETGKVLRRNKARSAIVRITVTPGPQGHSPTLVVMLRQLWKADPPIRLAISPFPVNPRSPLAGLKTTSRLHYEISRQWARAKGCVDALVGTTDGDLTEGTISNLFCVADGKVRTPPLPRGILPGVVRRHVLRLCRRHGVPAVEKTILREDLRNAEEIFITNSSQGVLPVDRIVGIRRRFPGVRGPRARRIQDLYRAHVDRYKRTRRRERR